MQKKSLFKGVVGGVLVLIILFGITKLIPKADTSAVVVPSTMPVATKETTGNAVTNTDQTKVKVDKISTPAYKDGSYVAMGNYESPEGAENINVTLTLKFGIITDAQVVAEATNHRSLQYQNMFIGGFKQYVIGKNIDQVSLGKVSGSSLTPIGFNDALLKIKSEARA